MQKIKTGNTIKNKEFPHEELLKMYDVEALHTKPLKGDINYSNIKFELVAKDNVKYILKIFPDAEELQLAKEESRILNEINKHISFKVPFTIENIHGQLFSATENGEAKLLRYIEGAFIADVAQTPELLFSLGKKIAELDKALAQVQSPVLKSRTLFWDIQHAELSFRKTIFMAEPAKKKIVDYYFDRFRHFIAPQLNSLRHSIIHGDLNDYNILVKDNTIEGFLDFGDATYTPLINELAVACTYIMLNKQKPFEEILPLIKGYHEILPLNEDEIILLPDLITVRLCISVCNSAEKKYTNQDDEYVLISEKPAWQLLEQWIKTNPLKIKLLFSKAIGFNTDSFTERRETIIAARKKHTGSSLSLSYRKPLYFTGAAFQYMYDEQGNTYLDAYNNIPHVGHCHPKISSAISGQVRILNTNTRYLFDSFYEYIEKLLRHFPPALNKVFFVNSGSAATDLAVRMAKTHTGRNYMAVLEQGYHGNSIAGIEVSSYKFDGRGGSGTPPNIIKLPLPKEYMGIFSSGAEYAGAAKAQLQREIAMGRIPAAFIAEPVSGCGGQVFLAQGYLKEIQLFLKQQGVLTIIDEVQTGFGRLGNYFWGFEMHGIIPDIVILGKPMANGHPVAAVVTTEEVAQTFANGMEFFSSFGGNSVSCSAAGAMLDVLVGEQLQENAKEVGEYFHASLRELQTSFPLIGDIRGEGLFLGIELVDDQNRPSARTAQTLTEFLKERFILTGTDGPFNNVIKIKPPLCFNKSDVDHFINILDEGLNDRLHQ